MSRRARSWLAVLLFNAALAGLIAAAAPGDPVRSDRNNYDYNGKRWMLAYCSNTMFCYRFLVPALLEFVPMEPGARWRAYQWIAHTASGAVVAMSTPLPASPLLTSVLVQTSYGFAFTAYDPYSADALVFLVAALTLYLWQLDRILAMTLIAGVGVFAKETVALIATAPVIAVMLAERWSQRWRWLRWWTPAFVAWVVILSFHWYMDTYAGWSVRGEESANFTTGSWFIVWWRSNPPATKALLLFAPFGFGWAFAILGFRHATPRIRQLALATIIPIAVLVYVQTPERALGNAFFVVVPLAAAFLSILPPTIAWAAAITNGLVTAKIGLSTTWLPPTSILLVPATAAAVWAFASSPSLKLRRGGPSQSG